MDAFRQEPVGLRVWYTRAMAPDDMGMTPAKADLARPTDPLVEQVYGQLRAIAQRQLQQERAGHTLQATALVHEAYLRLAGAKIAWSSPGAFYVAAAEAMRRILIEHARKRGRVKRGGDARRLDLDLGHVAELGDADPDRIMALDDAFRRLEGADPRAASVVALRFYAGLSIEQAALALGLSERTVKREWEFARAWLFERLAKGEIPIDDG
jgi:RNA polymerase sigma factor (TIGR02999 family)